MGNVARSKTTRGEGLVPRWGRAWAWQDPPGQFDGPKSQLRVFISWCPGASRHERLVRKWYFAARECPHSTAPALVYLASQRSLRRKPESKGAGLGNVVRGLVPRWGRGMAKSLVRIRHMKRRLTIFHALMQPSESHGNSHD